jgi:pantoate--beta-alanine ligase
VAVIILRTRVELLHWREKVATSSKTVGFVPTMGALHRGHLVLLQRAVAENDFCVLSIFVNPAQFAPSDDLASYPRTLERDIELAAQAGVSVVFVPSAAEIYPQGFATEVSIGPAFSSAFEGAARPGHFSGVCLVVLILLNLVQARNVYFGQKDYQQVVVLKQLLSDLAHPSKMIIVPTVRDSDGLALSSRNVYLTPRAREIGLGLPRSLAAAAKLFYAGERNPAALLAELKKVAEQSLCALDYAVCLLPWTLIQAGETASPDATEAAHRAGVVGEGIGFVMLATAKVEVPQSDAVLSSVSVPPVRVVRLLDNLVLFESEPWRSEALRLLDLFQSEGHSPAKLI